MYSPLAGMKAANRRSLLSKGYKKQLDKLIKTYNDTYPQEAKVTLKSLQEKNSTNSADNTKFIIDTYCSVVRTREEIQMIKQTITCLSKHIEEDISKLKQVHSVPGGLSERQWNPLIEQKIEFLSDLKSNLFEEFISMGYNFLND
jgi:5-methylcytosine-specific restriction endonuclease McrBC regulatory subunit McrC